MPDANDPEPTPLTADEMLVESQLVAMGLLEPRATHESDATSNPRGSACGSDEGENGGVCDAIIPASKHAKAEMARQVQSIISFVERAHGLRMQAVVAEFVQAHSQVFVLLAIHAVQWDAQATRGRLGTFTERWSDYRSGLGPMPAPQPPHKPSNAPGLLLAGGQDAVVLTDRSAGMAPGAALIGASLDWQRRFAGVGGRPSTAVAGRPVSVRSSWESRHVSDVRPGTAPAQIVHVHRAASARPAAGFGGARNGHGSLRNVVASARPGAGGNPSCVAPAADSYALVSLLWHSILGRPQPHMIIVPQ